MVNISPALLDDVQNGEYQEGADVCEDQGWIDLPFGPVVPFSDRGIFTSCAFLTGPREMRARRKTFLPGGFGNAPLALPNASIAGFLHRA